MKNSDNILEYLRRVKWPNMISNTVRILTIGESLIIEDPPIPMKFVWIFAAFTYLVIVSLAYWKIRDQLVVIAPMGLLSCIGCCMMMSYMERTRRSVGPFAVIDTNIKTYDGTVVEFSHVRGIYDVYFVARGKSGRGQYRVVLVISETGIFPILWQISSYGKWVRPKIDVVCKKIGGICSTIRIPEIITAT